MRTAQGEARTQLAQGINNNAQPNLDDQFEMTLSWESSNHFTEIVIEDGSLIFVYKDPTGVPKDIQLFIFINKCVRDGKQGPEIAKLIAENLVQIPDLSKMTDFEFQSLLQLFRTHHNIVQIVNDEYVVTADNFLKMCIIYLRVQSRVPVVIMGETGCGKTSLIKFFSQNILNDELIIFNIHAGITAKMILEKVYECILVAESMDQDKKLWVFFDEFNTSENLGLICEILSERTILGKPIPDNICLLAACNPFKLRSKKVEFGENVGIKRAKAQNRMAQNLLMYTVHPIPENIIENVWDFGALQDEDAQKYINQMLTKGNIGCVPMITSMLLACHSYFKLNEDNSSVSLRDVARFIILCQWFKNSIKVKRTLEREGGRWQKSQKYLVNKDKYNLKVEDYYNITDIDLRASVLALTHCYYLRISNMKARYQFLQEVCTAQKEDATLTPKRVLDIINCEQNDYIIRMDLQEGTAVNQALKENIFAIIPCIINRIPIFICGKPGCSKSMAISLVFQNLRGQKSVDPYFKTLRELTMVSFQGSESCTSDGILKAYEKAKKYLELQRNDIANNLLPVFVFDEIGLAEISKYNPLKVLHSLLEVENREIAFVGISNWRLDASKMNRALYLARPDPDEEDLKFTAFCIYHQICLTGKHKHLIECLESSYFELKDYFKKQKPEFQDFYGLRDFYHMIKQISRAINLGQHTDNDHPDRDLLYHVNLAIARNFGGRFEASEILGKFFSKKFDVLDKFPVAQKLTPNVRNLIQMNMSDRDSRYLMLIGRPDVLRFILETYFKEQILESRTIVGSKLANDQSKEEYGFRALSDIILYVEKGISIILYGMEDIYSSLYDLFNQNFAVYGEKRYCRIALGAQLNPQCFVHEHFHSVIFMNDDDDSLQAADAPFLNRFEKHHVRLEDILNEHQKYIVNELIGWVDSLLNNRMREKQILLHETNIFPNFSEEMLGILVMQEEWPEDIDDEKELYKQVIQNCKKRLLKIATQDILVLAQLADIDGDESRWITQNYQEIHQIPFLDELKGYVNKDNQQERMAQKVLALTYTLGFDISISENSDGRINFRSISNFKSEQEIVKQLHQFYESETETVFILDANYITDKSHVSFIKFIVDKVERDAIDGKAWNGCKTVLFMLHMQRNFHEKNQSQVPVFDESWEQVVYYDTSLEPFTLSEAMVTQNTRQLLMGQSVVKFDQSLKNMTEKCLLKLTFDGELSQEDQDSINDNMFFIIENITADPQLVACFQKKIFASIMSQQRRIIDWKDEISCNIDVIKDATNVQQAIKMVIEARYEQYLTVLLFQIEMQTAFRSYFTEFSEIVNGEKQPIVESIQLIKKIWIQSFNQLKTDQIELQTLPQSNYAIFIANLRFPFSRSEAQILKDIYKTQVAFESANEEAGQTPIEHFSEQFIAKSKFGDLIDEIINDKNVQEVYIQDIVKIFLIENLLKPQYLAIVMTIMKKIMNNPNNSFYEKLYIFMKNQKLFFSLCTILDLFQQLKGERFSLKDLEMGFQEQLDDMSEGKTWQDMIRKILDSYIIKNSQPDQYALHNLKSINNMSTIYEKFFSNLFNFKSTVNLKNLSIIRFWTDFTALVAEQGGIQQNFLFRCSEIAFKIDGDIDENDSDDDAVKPAEEETNFMADIRFINMVLVFYETGGKRLVSPVIDKAPAALDAAGSDNGSGGDDDTDDDEIIDHDLINLDDRTVKFLSSFFTIILEMDFKRLAIIAKRFQMPQYKSLFRYSSSIFQEIMRQTQLLPTVEDFRVNVQNNEVVVDVANDVIPEIELPDSYEIEVLEKVLGKVGLDSNFAIAINDVITRYVADNTEGRVYSLNLLANEFQLHQRLLVWLQVPEAERVRDIQQSNIKSLVAHAVLKTICEVYTDLIFFNNLERERVDHPDWDIAPFEETDDLMDARLIIEDELSRRDWGPVRTLQMYCLKQLKQKMKVTNAQFKDALGLKYAPTAKWIEESEALHEDQEAAMPLDSFPHLQEVSEAQEEFIRDVKNFLVYRLPEQKGRIKDRMREMNNVQDLLKTGLAFLKAFYLQYADAKQAINFDEFEKFYQEELEEIAEIKCGVAYARLLKCLISNFPKGNFLRMENDLPQMEMHQRTLCCQILLHTLVHTKTPNPISSLFYSYDADGKFTLEVANFNGCFMPGIELKPKYTYLFDLYTNFEDKKNKDERCEGYGGANYLCGDGCDFFYIVGDCGNLVGPGTCPWCKRDIGAYGGYGKLQPRPGFRRFKEQDAKDYLKQLLVKHEQDLQPGYSVVEQANQVDFQMSFFKTRPISWRLIRQFVHIPLYFLLTVGGCTQDTFNQVISVQNLKAQLNKTPQEFLQSHIVNDFKVLEKLLSISGQDNIAPWLYAIVNRYSTELKAGVGMNLKSNDNARRFEEAFDTLVLGNLAEKIGDVAIEYKNSLQVKGGKAMNTFDAALQEIAAVEGIYPGLQFYRLVRAQSFEDMITSFKNVKANEQAFPIIKVCINKYETLIKLRHLYPIIEFTNHLIGKFNHMLKREDARQKKIKEYLQQNEEGRQLKVLFESFLKAWAGMGLDSIQFECHELQKLNYDEQSELINFLPDNKERGNGMAMLAAMQELGKLQNNILTEVLNEYSKQKKLESKYVLDTHQYPIQRIKPHHIVSFPIDDPLMIQAFTMNSLAYGHGQEVVYDFGRMEMNILKDFEQRKFLSTDKDSFEYIQYQMEMFTSSGSKKNFILEIRGRIKQSPFDRETSIKIDQYFEVIENRGLEDKIQTLRDLHGGLEKILCFLQNTREAGESTIELFVSNKMKGNKHRVYSESTTLSQVKLKNIIALYEKLEEKYFPHVTKSIRPDYTSMANQEAIRVALEGMLKYTEVAPKGAAGNEGQLIPSRRQIQNGLLRFIIRCLAGEFTKEDNLGMWFASKYDVWDQELYEEQDYKLDNLQEHMTTANIKLEDTYCTYKVLHELNFEKDQRALAPQIGQQDAPRVNKSKPNVPQPIGPPPPRQVQNQKKPQKVQAQKKPAAGDGFL